MNKDLEIQVTKTTELLKHKIFTATVDKFSCMTVNLKRGQLFYVAVKISYNVHWKQHMTHTELYGDLPKLYSKISDR